MKKNTNLIAVIIIGILLFSAISKTPKRGEFNHISGEYLYILHYGEKDIDKRLTKKAQAICNAYGGKGRKIRVTYDPDPLDYNWNAYTTKLSNGTYLIVTATESEKTLYHEVAHVITFEEEDMHGPSWKMMITKMGYPQEAARYDNH